MSFLSNFSRKPLSVLLLVSIILGLWVVPRWIHKHEAFEPDIMTYAVIAHELNLGKTLYVDIFDNKPPGIFLTFALFQKIFGYSDGHILAINLFFSLLCGIFLFLLGKKYTHHLIYSLLAALCWFFYSLHARSLANQPQTELIINTFQILGLCLLAHKRSPLFLLAASFSWAVATFFKQTAIVLPFFMGLFFIFESKKPTVQRFWNGFLVAAPTLIIWGLCFSYFALQGHLDTAWMSLVKFGSEFAKSPILNLLKAFDISRSFREHIYWGAPFILFSLFLIFKKTPKKLSFLDWIFIIYLVSRPFQVVMPGRWYPHYFQIYLPLFVYAIIYILGQLKKPIFKNSLMAYALAVGVFAAYPTLTLDSDSLSAHKYGSSDFVEAKKFSETFYDFLEDKEFHVWGIYPNIHYYTKTRPRFGVLWNIHLGYKSAETYFENLYKHDLKNNGPIPIVISNENIYRRNNTFVSKYLATHYVPLDMVNSFQFKIYRHNSLNL